MFRIVYQGFLKIKSLRNPAYFTTWMTRIILSKSARFVSKKKRVVDYDEDRERESHKEHLPENTVKSYLARARGRLKEILKEDYNEDL